MKVNIEKLKELRKRTLVSYTECKNALLEANNVDDAVKLLRKKGHKFKDKVSERKTDYGVVESYIHPGNRICSIVEVKCESDLVSKTREIKGFAKEIAMQVASMKPWHLSRNQVDKNLAYYERERRVEKLEREGVDPFIVDEIADGEMSRWYSEICLLEQSYIKDHSISVKDLLSDLIAKVGENCKISRFKRWEVGGLSNEERWLRAGFRKVSGSYYVGPPAYIGEPGGDNINPVDKVRTGARLVLWFFFTFSFLLLLLTLLMK